MEHTLTPELAKFIAKLSREEFEIIKSLYDHGEDSQKSRPKTPKKQAT